MIIVFRHGKRTETSMEIIIFTFSIIFLVMRPYKNVFMILMNGAADFYLIFILMFKDSEKYSVYCLWPFIYVFIFIFIVEIVFSSKLYPNLDSDENSIKIVPDQQK